MSKALEILKSYAPATVAEENVLNDILDRLGRRSLDADTAIEQIIDRLDWPLDRAAAEVDAYLE
ncbi:hypothetical protein [Azospirillum sp. B4]|uniref:hypothetical protein n=1 Tax=Azospirillum sp. B4 TaxID=95605 RepID=UPI000344E025|nr:hypothetical protein [Azospirillum sp. B4]